MIDLILVGFRQTLDDLILEDVESPHFIELMERAEEYLDVIQERYGQEVYEGMDKCYTYTLVLKPGYKPNVH